MTNSALNVAWDLETSLYLTLTATQTSSRLSVVTVSYLIMSNRWPSLLTLKSWRPAYTTPLSARLPKFSGERSPSLPGL